MFGFESHRYLSLFLLSLDRNEEEVATDTPHKRSIADTPPTDHRAL